MTVRAIGCGIIPCRTVAETIQTRQGIDPKLNGTL
jgi:hypothetical protein